jgi:hypothetical protein
MNKIYILLRLNYKDDYRSIIVEAAFVNKQDAETIAGHWKDYSPEVHETYLNKTIAK